MRQKESLLFNLKGTKAIIAILLTKIIFCFLALIEKV